MPRLRRSYCEHEARRLVGAPVRVLCEDLGPKVAGRASHDGEGWVIRLSPRLLGDVKALALTFWHECEHLRLGHVGRLNAVNADPPPIIRELWAKEAGAKEAAADAYAAQRWARLGEHAAVVMGACLLEEDGE